MDNSGSMHYLLTLSLTQHVAQVNSAQVGISAVRTTRQKRIFKNYTSSNQWAHEGHGLPPSLVGLDESLKRIRLLHGHAEDSGSIV